MSFQVKDFEFQEKNEETIWKFNLGGMNTTQIDFYSQDENTRSLYHLAVDYIGQIEGYVERKKKKITPNGRVVRKICEKLIKYLGLKLAQFSDDICEDVKDVRKFFQKEDLDENSYLRIWEKCQRWIIETWVQFLESLQNLSFQENYNNNQKKKIIQLSLSAESFFQATNKYINSYINDKKRLCPDFEALNELYLIVIGDQFTENNKLLSQTNNNWILIDINLNIEQKFISESFLWNPQNKSNIAIHNFVEHFLSDVLVEQKTSLEKDLMNEYLEEAKIQLKTQICYKSLLKKYTGLLLNFSTMELSQDIKEYTIQIELKIQQEDGKVILEDRFEWDILNEMNNVQKFCQKLVEDTGIPSQYLSQLCYKIRTQINAELQWKYTMLVKTYKSILRDRQSPKFHTQTTTTQIRKNLVYTMDVSLPYNPDQTKPAQKIDLNNSDLFSLLSRNLDILPQDFQQALLCKQTHRNQDSKQSKLNKFFADEYLKKKNLPVQGNQYLGNFANSYTYNRIWRQSTHNSTN